MSNAWKNSLGMCFVPIPAGSFMMGEGALKRMNGLLTA